MDFSIILPCYNEGRKVENSIQQIIGFMDDLNKTYEIIIVNDGSTNNTKEILKNDVVPYLKDMKEKNIIERYVAINYDNNKGKGNAIKVGIAHSKGDIVLFMDVDLSTDLSAINDVIKYDNYDVIIGSRRINGANLEKKQPLIRQITGKGCLILTNLIVPLHIIDTQCGFKAFKGDFARELIKKQTIDRFAFDVEYLYIAKLNDKTIKEIPVIWNNDDDSKVSLVSSSIDFFKSLFIIRKNKKYYKL